MFTKAFIESIDSVTTNSEMPKFLGSGG